MFREMRRKKQALSLEECRAVLDNGTSGVLAAAGDDGYPYAVPLSYAGDESKIFFHCAQSGHKLDAIARSDKVSFCVIDEDQVAPEKFTTHYRSVVAFGRARILERPEEKRRALEILVDKYAPDHKDSGLREIDRLLNQTCVIELAVEHLSGKQSPALIKDE